jgi:alpha-ketoglutarate-dependent taurine dioxygenase
VVSSSPTACGGASLTAADRDTLARGLELAAVDGPGVAARTGYDDNAAAYAALAGRLQAAVEGLAAIITRLEQGTG